MTLKERIRILAKEFGISIPNLESVLGFGSGTISKWDKSAPSADKLQKVAEYFNVTLDYLMKGESAENGSEYYINPETAKAAQEIFENKELRALFDATRDADPEDLRALHSMALALKRKERGYDDDTGC